MLSILDQNYGNECVTFISMVEVKKYTFFHKKMKKTITYKSVVNIWINKSDKQINKYR